MYVFYADVFVLQNFLINVIVLLCVARLRKIHSVIQLVILVLMALVGSVLELLLLLVSKYYWYFTLLSYVVVLPFVTGIALKVKNLKDFLKCYIGCLVAVIMLGGSTEFLENLFGIRQLPFLLVLTIGVAIALALERFLRFQKISRKMLPVILQYGTRQVDALALYDSGNRLREPYQGKGVHIITPEMAEKLGVISKQNSSGLNTKHANEKQECIGKKGIEQGSEGENRQEVNSGGQEKLVYSVLEMEQFGMVTPERSEDNQKKQEARVIPYTSLGSSGLLVIYTIDSLKILEPGMQQEIEAPVIGIARPELMINKNYQIILNQEVDI